MQKMKLKLFIAVAAFLFILAPAVNAASASGFTDVPEGFWAESAITDFSEQGIVNGFGDGTYQPNTAVTRVQAATILVRALDLEADSSFEMEYEDVKESNPSYAAIAALTDLGIMSGNEGKFYPEASLKRSEMAVILDRAFELEGNEEVSFKDVDADHFAYDAVSALLNNDITVGYEDETFRPNEQTTRAQFVVFLSRAMNIGQTDNDNAELKALLKTAYQNEANINSYQLDSSMNMELRLPESVTSDPDLGAITQLLGDIQVDISGSYQKDPMMMDMTVDVTLQGGMGTISMPLIMTEEKMWFKLPEALVGTLPEELDGKFIEFDLDELTELNGDLESGVQMDLDLQTKLAVALNELVVEHFADDFYEFVEADAIAVPNGIDTKQVVKFELTNESIDEFVVTLLEDFLPEFFQLLDDPEYAAAIGITQEEVKEVMAQMDLLVASKDLIVAEIKNTLDINTFEEYSVINTDDIIGYSLMNLDLDVTVEKETVGFGLAFDQTRSNINEKITITLPSSDEVITYDELLELEEQMMQ